MAEMVSAMAALLQINMTGEAGAFMRQPQQNRRNRGRGGRNNRSSNPLTKSYQSNGPDVKIKGTAAQIAEQYMALARDAQSSGNNVTAENYFQHAEHYHRIIHAAQAKLEEQANAQQAAKAARSNNMRRGRQQQVNGTQSEAAPEEGKEAIPGTGKQPAISSGKTLEKGGDSEEKPKPKRKPRPRKPKAASKEALPKEAAKSKAEESKEAQGNVTA